MAFHTTLTAVLTGALAVFAAEQAAHACGGTFCDGGPSVPFPMPVDQTGENILFIMDGAEVEAQIQIQYTGDAHKFAWVLPVPTVPEVAVGSLALIQNAEAGTVPTYGVTVSFDNCAPPDTGGCSSQSDAAAAGCASVGCTAAGCTVAGCGPRVVSEETVGAFDVTVLAGGTAKEVSDWLAMNGYASNATTPALLETYTKKSYVFLAVKLVPGAGVNEIHPLAVRYPGTMPCIPLILTAEAAVDNMGVRAFFLANDRVFPENYATVTLNDLQINWINAAANYDQVVAAAVDEAPDHLGFVTEYAGSPSVVSQRGIFGTGWDAAPFNGIAPELVVQQLQREGLVACGGGSCSFLHPLILGLLEQYLPPQGGLSPNVWYARLAQESALIDMNVWDAAAFAKALDDRIVQPGAHALAALEAADYLTRLFTRISPEEMTDDPTFNERPDRSDETVSNTHTADLHSFCGGGPQIVTLPDGRQIVIPVSSTWPVGASMPSAALLESVPPSGDSTTLVDNTGDIQSRLDAFNDEHGLSSGCSLERAGASAKQSPFALALVAAAFAAFARSRRGRSLRSRVRAERPNVPPR